MRKFHLSVPFQGVRKGWISCVEGLCKCCQVHIGCAHNPSCNLWHKGLSSVTCVWELIRSILYMRRDQWINNKLLEISLELPTLFVYISSFSWHKYIRSSIWVRSVWSIWASSFPVKQIAFYGWQLWELAFALFIIMSLSFDCFTLNLYSSWLGNAINSFSSSMIEFKQDLLANRNSF